MKIGIDIFEANQSSRVGVGWYAYELISRLITKHPEHTYYLFSPTPPLSDLPKPSLSVVYCIGKPESLYTIRQLPKLIKRTGAEVIFSPTHYAPIPSPIPSVLALMDCSYIHYPNFFKLKDLIQLRLMGGYSIKKASHIITISEFSKAEIIKFYNKKNTDISVCYPGLRSNLEANSQDESLNLKDNATLPYILYVGTFQPRKNIERLIKAFEYIRENCQLILVGKKGWIYDKILNTIQKSTKKSLISHIDYADESALQNLYKNASCFALPSLYEGFGMPALEAMYYGVPCVLSSNSSLIEVGGQAAIFVNELDIFSIAKGLQQALQLNKEDKKLLALRAKAQVERFNWDKSIEVLNNVLLKYENSTN